MDLGEIWNSILSIFWLSPWWLKIIIICIVIGIPLSIIEKISEVIGSVSEKTKIATQMRANPEMALKTLESGSFAVDDYEKYLLEIVKKTESFEAMEKLVELYSGEKYASKRDEAKCKFWNKRAAEAGDINCIQSRYGFSDYDVFNNFYDEMLRDLETAKAKTASEDIKALADYQKGIVYYKMGETDLAKQLFTSSLVPKLVMPSIYMMFRCYIKEADIEAAEKELEKLEAGKFEIPAADYLDIYDYYATKRENGEPDYKVELRYVDKYASCKDADREISNKIGGETYYYMAVALQNGNSYSNADVEEVWNAYEKAAGFGNAEALYYLGKNYWSGENIHDYFKANDFLLQAAQKGHKQAKELLMRYGVDGILVSPKQVVKKTYYFLDCYELTALEKNVQWLSLYFATQYKTKLIATEFIITYKNTFKSFEHLVNGVHQLYANSMAQMLKWSIQLLMFFSIDAYSAADIMSECEDLSLLPRVPRFEMGLEQIDNRAEQLQIRTAYAQASRGQWSGAGFGTSIGSTVSATVQASVAAGVMNVGSGILHGIGDSIVKAMDNSEIKGMGKKLFENPETEKEFCNAVLSACMEVANVVLGMIEEHCNIAFEELEGEVLFEGENLAEFDDRVLDAKIDNNTIAQNWNYTYALLVEKLRRQPLDSNIFKQVFALAVRRGVSFEDKVYESAAQYARDFNMLQVFLSTLK